MKKRYRKWSEDRKTKNERKQREKEHKKEFEKCKKSLRDLLIDYGRIEKVARDVYKKDGIRQGLEGFQLAFFINEELEKNKQLNDKDAGLIIWIAKKIKCGDQNQELKPCVDDENASNECLDKERYEDRAREEAKTYTVSYLEEEIKKLEKGIKKLQDDPRRDKDDEKLLKKYKEMLETYKKRLEIIEAEPAPRRNRRFRNSWSLEEESMAVVGLALKF
jgi:hypothetical protein